MSNQAEGRGAASPVVVFLCLLALLGAVTGGVIWAGQTDDEPLPPAPVASSGPTEDQTLTDAEAIARFKELDALRIRALEERNLSLISDALTPGGVVRERLRRTIQQLQEQDVIVDEEWELIRIDVVRNDSFRIELRAVANSDVRFFDSQGNEVTGVAVAERRTLSCVLRRSDGAEWLLDTCRNIRAVPLER